MRRRGPGVCAPVDYAAQISTEVRAARFQTEEEAAAASRMVLTGFHACWVLSVLMVIAVLSILKLDGATFEACWIFAPVFIVAGTSFCCLACVVCFAADPDQVVCSAQLSWYLCCCGDYFSGRVGASYARVCLWAHVCLCARTFSDPEPRS